MEDRNLKCATSQPQNQVKSGFFLDVIVTQGTAIFQLFTSKDQTLLVWRNAFFVLDLGLHILNGVALFHFKGDCLSCECFDENLHDFDDSRYDNTRTNQIEYIDRRRNRNLELMLDSMGANPNYGSSIYDVHKKIGILTPSPCAHAST